LFLTPDIIGIKVERKGGEWLGQVKCMWHDDAHWVIRNPKS